MPLIDADGRLFGRVNLFDALAALVILAMIPVAYIAYLLFRPPPARLITTEPKRITQGPNLRLQIFGENLRPFMRISLNNVQARTFLIESTKGAEIDLPDLGPGTYDVVLFDYAKELSRLPKALTVLPNAPLPSLTLEVAGAFVGLAEDGAKEINAGDRLTEGASQAEVLAVEPPVQAQLRLRAGEATVAVPVEGQWQRPATLRVGCFPESHPDGSLRCVAPGEQQAVVLMPDALLTFKVRGKWLSFQVSEVHLDSNPEMKDARVRFVGSSSLLALMQNGDVDGTARIYSRAHSARVLSLEPVRISNGALPASLGLLAPGESAAIRDAVLRLPVERSANGWIYRGRPAKAGAVFVFEAAGYLVQGQILSVK
jgi:Domain of unknown function (DUF4330)